MPQMVDCIVSPKITSSNSECNKTKVIHGIALLQSLNPAVKEEHRIPDLLEDKSSFTDLYVSRQSFGPKFRVVWPRKMPASGWGSLWESSSFVPWFSTFVFRNVPGTVSECVRICWFKRNSSNLDRAPKMRDSVRLNSWDNFLVTLPPICSETCVIYSSLILGTDVFRDWPFLGFSSCVFLVTAANFRLFLNVAIFWREMLRSYEDWISFIC